MNRRSIELLIQRASANSHFFTSRISRRLVGALCTVLLFATSQSVLAGSITYPNPANGSFAGNTVIYGPDFGPADHGVTESSITDPVPLFGSPTVTGDSISFTPTGFGTFASGGSVDVTDGQLVFKILAKPSFVINNVSFSEAGITTLFGSGTDITHTDVSADGILNILQVDGVGINSIPVPIHLLFTPLTTAPPARPGDPLGTSGTFRLVSDGPLSSQDWNGSQGISLNQVLIDHGITFTHGVTLLSVDMDNTLIAQSQLGTIALIDKKFFGGLSITVNQGSGGGPNGPEPTSLVLACLGFIGVLGARRLGR
ncbi:MAG TPA: PEP-CTERM sorting domain-containing protein [Tepidisphaeraceae bacterium]|nr:PEP-CTERM sorting domain-containing protein [Tepidisphaeraceae bacterium]